jgi:hypothetical protein
VERTRVALVQALGLEHDLGTMEKQIRMLKEMAVTAPVVVRPEGTFAIVPQRLMADLIERLEEEAGILRSRLRKRVV